MRFGLGGYALEQVQTHGGAVVGRDLLADAMLAEELGFDSLWVAENHFSRDRQCSSPFVIAGVLAGATRRIRIGVFSILTFAHPLRVAEDAATLDLMSGGRLMLCFGTGYRAEEFAAFGIAMQGKGARFRDAWRWCKRRGLGHLCITANTFAYPQRPRTCHLRPVPSLSCHNHCKRPCRSGWRRLAMSASNGLHARGIRCYQRR